MVGSPNAVLVRIGWKYRVEYDEEHDDAPRYVYSLDGIEYVDEPEAWQCTSDLLFRGFKAEMVENAL